jgi:hypothetical protein
MQGEYRPAFDIFHRFVDDSYCIPHRLTEVSMATDTIRKRGVPGTLLLGRSAVLQPRHVTVFTANFMSPPTVGVAIEMARVCPPDTKR